jgi:hypothetical protein
MTISSLDIKDAHNQKTKEKENKDPAKAKKIHAAAIAPPVEMTPRLQNSFSKNDASSKVTVQKHHHHLD